MRHLHCWAQVSSGPRQPGPWPITAALLCGLPPGLGPQGWEHPLQLSGILGSQALCQPQPAHSQASLSFLPAPHLPDPGPCDAPDGLPRSLQRAPLSCLGAWQREGPRVPTCPRGGLTEGGPHGSELAFQPKTLNASASVTAPCPRDPPLPRPHFAEKTSPAPPSVWYAPLLPQRGSQSFHGLCLPCMHSNCPRHL